MKIKIVVIAVLTGLLVNGCSSDNSEYKTKLAYYELCMDTEANDYISSQASGGYGVHNPATNRAYTAFEYATARCEQFKP